MALQKISYKGSVFSLNIQANQSSAVKGALLTDFGDGMRPEKGFAIHNRHNSYKNKKKMPILQSEKIIAMKKLSLFVLVAMSVLAVFGCRGKVSSDDFRCQIHNVRTQQQSDRQNT